MVFFARLGAAGHEHVEPGRDAGIQKTRGRRGECAEADQFVEMVRAKNELANVVVGVLR